MINIELFNNASPDAREILLNFLEMIDCIFPIPLSKKIDLSMYVDRYLSKAFILVAKDQGSIIGINIFYGNDYLTHKAHITIIGILEPYRSLGIESKLISECFKIVEKQGMTSIDVLTTRTNYRAIHFYKSHGFQIDPSYASNRDYLLEKVLSAGGWQYDE